MKVANMTYHDAAGTLLKRIRLYDEALEKVSSPFNPNDNDTKTVMEMLIDKGHFLIICTDAFGSLRTGIMGLEAGSDFSKREEPKTWVDKANAEPESEFAKSLFKLLSPTGNLCRVMREMSRVPCDFAAIMQSKLQERDDLPIPFMSDTDDALHPLFDLPLQVFNTTAEEHNVESFASPQQQPSILYLPFWNPPFATCDIADFGKVRSLRTFMLPYFCIRMMLFLGKASLDSCASLIASQSAPVEHSKLYLYAERFMQFISVAAKPNSNAFFSKLFGAFLEEFGVAQMLQPFISAQSCTEIEWGLPEVAAGMIVHGPMDLWLRHARMTDFEHNRLPLRSPLSMQLLLHSLPFARSIWSRLGVVRASGSEYRHRHATFGVAPQIGIELTNSRKTVFRAILGALREVIISLPLFPGCTEAEYRTIFATWLDLVSGELLQNPTSEHSVLTSNYEAFVVIVSDILLLMCHTNLIKRFELTTLSELARCLTAVERVVSLHRDWVQNLSETLMQDPASPLLDHVFSSFALNWSRDRGCTELAMTSKETISRAGRVLMSISEGCKIAPAARCSLLDQIFKTVSGIYPQAEAEFRKGTYRVERRAFKGTEASSSHLHPAGPRSTLFFTDDAKFQFLHGKASFARPNVEFMMSFKRPTDNSPRPMKSNEIPLLVCISSVVDVALNWILLKFYLWRGKGGRCEQGHCVAINATCDATCGIHASAEAAWFCPRCDSFFCEQCCGPVRSCDGFPLSRCEDVSVAAACRRCNVVVPKGTPRVETLQGESICVECSDLPMHKISCRFLATTNTILAMAVMVVLYWFCLLNFADNSQEF